MFQFYLLYSITNRPDICRTYPTIFPHLRQSHVGWRVNILCQVVVCDDKKKKINKLSVVNNMATREDVISR